MTSNSHHASNEDRVCHKCGKSAYRFPECPWCGAAYSPADVEDSPGYSAEAGEKNTSEKGNYSERSWPQWGYFLEFIFVAIPVAIFDFITLPLLIGVAPRADPTFSVVLSCLWIGGCFGTYALWSMYFRLYENKSARTFRDLPLIALGCGITANSIPVFYFIFTVTKSNQAAFVAFCLAFLAPTYVSFHWASALLRNGKTS